MISDNQFIKNKYVANFSSTLTECPYSPVVLIYFLNWCCHACILGWGLHNLCQCWGKKRKRKKEIKKKKKPQDLSREKMKNLLQEFQPKGTELSIVLGVLLLHLLALWAGQWLVSFDKKVLWKKNSWVREGHQAVWPSSASLGSAGGVQRKRREATASASCCPEGEQLAWKRWLPALLTFGRMTLSLHCYMQGRVERSLA